VLRGAAFHHTLWKDVVTGGILSIASISFEKDALEVGSCENVTFETE
jgi:hypothetical protein